MIWGPNPTYTEPRNASGICEYNIEGVVIHHSFQLMGEMIIMQHDEC